MKKTKFTKEDFTDADLKNIQMQKASAKKWLEQDFVLGVEVRRSNNCDPDCEICEAGAGKYPKEYEWTIWHPGCNCFATSILASQDDFIASISASFDEKEHSFDGTIKDIPETMKKFIKKTGFVHYGHEIHTQKKRSSIKNFFRQIIKKNNHNYKCKMCEKDWPKKAMGNNGLCMLCDENYISALGNNVRRLQDSEDIITKSNNIKTIGDRFEFILDLLNELKVYEDKNIPVFDHTINDLISDKAFAVNQILISVLQAKYDITIDKINKAKSISAKEKAISSFFDDAAMVKKYLSQLGKNYQGMYDIVIACEDELMKD